MPSPDIVLKSKDGKLHAFEIKQLHRIHGVHQALLIASFDSTFFDKYWIAISGTEELSKRVKSAVEFADLKNVGVLHISEKKNPEIKIIKKPKGSPRCDRRHLLGITIG